MSLQMSGSKNYGTNYTMEFYAAERMKELIPFATARMELESITAKRNKPGGEGQIPYDLTFNWNIINRRKKANKI